MSADSPKQITVEDFDNAVKQSWGCDTCIVAQYMKRNGVPLSKGVLTFAEDHGLTGPLGQFDMHFGCPGDENKPELQALRASLPINLE